jgi:hypothetical protein
MTSLSKGRLQLRVEQTHPGIPGPGTLTGLMRITLTQKSKKGDGGTFQKGSTSQGVNQDRRVKRTPLRNMGEDIANRWRGLKNLTRW